MLSNTAVAQPYPGSAYLTADAFAPASDGIRDHFMHNYLAALEKNLA